MTKTSENHSPYAGKDTPSTAPKRDAKARETMEKEEKMKAAEEEKGTLLLEHAYRVGEGRVTCRLYGKSDPCTEYWVELEGLGTADSSALGSDRAAARAIYDTLVRNTVTPCTLRDVLEDWREQQPTVGLWQ